MELWSVESYFQRPPSLGVLSIKTYGQIWLSDGSVLKILIWWIDHGIPIYCLYPSLLTINSLITNFDKSYQTLCLRKYFLCPPLWLSGPHLFPRIYFFFWEAEHLSWAAFEIHRSWPNFWKKLKKLAIMQTSPMTKHLLNINIFGPVSPDIMRPQLAIFGGSHLSWAVLAILYQNLHSFYWVFWVMRQGRKI